MAVVVKKDSEVNWIPVRIIYHYKSKYPLYEGQARRKDHDFKLELEATLETKMPYELICQDHKLMREEVEIEVFHDTVTHYYAQLVYEGIEYIAHFTEFQLKDNPKGLIYRIADEFKQIVGRRLAKRTIIEWLKMDMAYYFPEYYPEYYKNVLIIIRANERLYGQAKYYPLLIRNIESVDEPIERVSEAVTPYYTFESAETFRQGLETVVAIVLERLTEEFLNDVYMFPTATEFKYESGVEGAKPDCNPSTTDIITARIDETWPIEENTYIVSAEMLRANNLADSPRVYTYWSEQYEEFLSNNISDIVFDIVEWYKSWYKEHFEKEE